MSRRKVYIVLLILSSIVIEQLHSQCSFTTVVAIEDLSSLTIPIQVEGAVNGDLSDPDQGVCGIELEFEHTMVGDLIIELISPAGDMVTLIGPGGPFGSTDFTNWNINFVRSSDMADPDDGFSPGWNNNQNWGVFGNYTGTYYPYLNDLEDFNTGPVNGEWTLFIQDGGQFDEGALLNFNIIFCDQEGIDCDPCTAEGGSVGPDFVQGCQGYPDLELQPQINFALDTPDTSVYAYTFILSYRDTVLELLERADLRHVDTGLYQLCGLSYALEDSSQLLQIPGNSVQYLEDLIEDPDSSFCGDLSTTCINVFIKPAPDTATILRTICRGDSLVIGTPVIKDEGMHLVRLDQTARNGCDSLVFVDLAVLEPDSFSLQPDSVSCILDSASLTGPFLPMAKYNWSGPFGFSDSAEMITVFEPGDYQLQITSDECSFTLATVVYADTIPPEYVVVQDTLTCGQDSGSVQLQTEATEVHWEGPGGYTASGATAYYAVPGTYKFTLTGVNGCITVDSIEAVVDSSGPVLYARDTAIGCNPSTIRLQLSSPDSLSSFNWDGPDGFQSVERDPMIDKAGIYHVTVTSPGGCQSVDSLTVGLDTIAPPASIAGDSVLNCTDSTGSLYLLNYENADSVIWTMADGTQITADSLEITEAGFYAVRVFSVNLCEGRDSIEIVSDQTKPQLTAEPDTLSCNSPLISPAIQGDPGLQYEWSGPGGFSSSLESPAIQAPGEYQLTATARNGCDTFIYLTIPYDSASYDLMPVVFDTISCRDTVVELVVAEPSAELNYSWISPQGDSIDGNTINATVAGQWHLLARDSGACSETVSVMVEIDTTRPDAVIAEPGSLPCEGSELMLDGSLSSGVSGLAYMWSALAGTITGSVDQAVTTVGSEGTYILEILNTSNSCLDRDTVEVEMLSTEIEVDAGNDLVLPEGSPVTLLADTDAGPGQIAGTAWYYHDELLCSNCDTFLLEPALAGTYVYEVIDTNGCVWLDEMRIEIAGRVKIYVPNAFSPNGDGVNDLFRPYFSSEVASVLAFDIYNRWGDKVFGLDISAASTDLAAWDGITSGKEAQNGLYVYILRVQLLSGEIIFLSGELNLIR